MLIHATTAHGVQVDRKTMRCILAISFIVLIVRLEIDYEFYKMD